MSSKPVPDADATRPKTVDADVVVLGYVSIALSLGLSIAINVYSDLHGGHLNTGIAWDIGLSVPPLIAIVSHFAARVKIHWVFQAWILAIVAAFMYVSATSIVKVLAPGIGLAPAIVLAVTVDSASLTMLGALMYARNQAEKLRQWMADEAERALLARQQEIRDKIAGGGTARETRTASARGNAAVAVSPAAGANEAALPAGTAPAPETADEDSAEEYGNVTSINRGAAKSDPELQAAADEMAMLLAADGEDITNRKFMATESGNTRRLSGFVKAARERYAPAAAAVRERRESDPMFGGQEAAALVASIVAPLDPARLASEGR